MTNSLKDAVIIQLTNMIQDNNKDLNLNLDDYDFEDGDEFCLYVKRTNGLKMIISLFGFEEDDIVNDSFAWNTHKIKILNLFNKLNILYSRLLENNLDFQNDRIELLCDIDTFLTKALIEYFVKDKDAMYIVNPCAFSHMNVYIVSFKNIHTLRKFMESKLFFKIKDIIV